MMMDYMKYGILAFLAIASFIDIKRKSLNAIFLDLSVLSIFILSFFFSNQEPLQVVLGLIPGLVMLFASFLTKGAIGIGDAILILGLGAFLVILRVLVVLTVASLLSLIIASIIWFKTKNGKKEIPFVPFLLAGYLVVFL
ncbi:MAG: prepilin peptidase [Lachnospiraceae bacterium]|nr:prepilin peptidase [Lachnospiraceae bacterium]